MSDEFVCCWLVSMHSIANAIENQELFPHNGVCGSVQIASAIENQQFIVTLYNEVVQLDC